MCGLLGGIVRKIEPHTESDPAVLAVQTIVTFWNVIGPKPHFRVEADSHSANLFVGIVGMSARGRKGTSRGYVSRIFRDVDRRW